MLLCKFGAGASGRGFLKMPMRSRNVKISKSAIACARLFLELLDYDGVLGSGSVIHNSVAREI